MHEFSYKTEIYLACKDDYAYTKITTITPLYVIVNETSENLMLAQKGVEDHFLSIPPQGRTPFHWNDFEKEMLISIKFGE